MINTCEKKEEEKKEEPNSDVEAERENSYQEL